MTVLQHRSLQNWVPCHTERSVQPWFEEQHSSVGQADPKSWPASNKHLGERPEHRIWYWLARLSLWKLLHKLCQRNGEQSQHRPIRYLWKSKPKRIAAVITAKGGPTMYWFWLINEYRVPGIKALEYFLFVCIVYAYMARIMPTSSSSTTRCLGHLQVKMWPVLKFWTPMNYSL